MNKMNECLGAFTRACNVSKSSRFFSSYSNRLRMRSYNDNEMFFSKVILLVAIILSSYILFYAFDQGVCPCVISYNKTPMDHISFL